MAGAGYKLFNTGDVLTAAQVNEYLMQQTVMVFASAAARTTALSGVLAEGMLSYLQDTNKVYVYDGSAWLDVSSEIPSQTGNSGKYLTTDGTNASWATISAGGMTSLASGSLAASATGFDLTSISGSYNELWLYITNYSTSTTADIQIRTNGNTVGDYSYNYYETASAGWSYTQGDNRFLIADLPNATRTGLSAFIRFPNYANSTGYKHISWQAANEDNTLWNGFGFTRSVSAINRITFSTTAGTFDSGTYALFGVK
jgi:hypothetical protein